MIAAIGLIVGTAGLVNLKERNDAANKALADKVRVDKTLFAQAIAFMNCVDAAGKDPASPVHGYYIKPPRASGNNEYLVETSRGFTGNRGQNLGEQRFFVYFGSSQSPQPEEKANGPKKAPGPHKPKRPIEASPILQEVDTAVDTVLRRCYEQVSVRHSSP